MATLNGGLASAAHPAGLTSPLQKLPKKSEHDTHIFSFLKGICSAHAAASSLLSQYGKEINRPRAQKKEAAIGARSILLPALHHACLLLLLLLLAIIAGRFGSDSRHVFVLSRALNLLRGLRKAGTTSCCCWICCRPFNNSPPIFPALSVRTWMQWARDEERSLCRADSLHHKPSAAAYFGRGDAQLKGHASYAYLPHKITQPALVGLHQG